MRILTADDVRRLFTMQDALEAVEIAAAAHSSGRGEAPKRYQLATAEPAGEMLVMPGVIDSSLFGLKLWYRFENPPARMPNSSACILILDPVHGQEVLLDGAVITDLRTGALTGLAARHLARPGASEIGLVGAGTQARTQVLALLEALPNIRKVRVFSRNTTRLSHFVGALRGELAGYPELTIDAVGSAEEACTGADIIVAATTSSSVVIQDAWVGEGSLVCGVGSHDPHSAELDPSTVARAEVIVVDTATGGIDGAGDILRPIARGLIRRSEVLELGQVVAGLKLDRSTAGIAIFKSVGFAAADVVAASLVATQAMKQDIGFDMDLHGAVRGQ